MTLSRQDRLLGLFRLGWAVKTHFVNFDLVPDLDWERAVYESIPFVEEPELVEEYFIVLQRLLARLRDGHTSVSLPQDLLVKRGRPPVEVEWVEGRPTFTWVEPYLMERGLRPGAVVLEIGGRRAEEVLLDLFGLVSASTEHGMRAIACRRVFVGAAEEPANVLVEDAHGPHEFLLPRTIPSAGRLPIPPVEARRLSSRLAYIAVNTFAVDEVVPAFDQALDGLLDAAGLILDLRRNDGGNGGYAREVAARLVDRPLRFERMRTRQTLSAFEAWKWPPMFLEVEPDVHPPRARPFLGPLTILTGPITWSAAEDFIVGLHAARRATLVGQPTHGSTGQPLQIPLPGGGHARVCTRRCLYPDGREFVGRGIHPEIPVPPTVKGLRAGIDEVLEAAVRRLGDRV